MTYILTEWSNPLAKLSDDNCNSQTEQVDTENTQDDDSEDINADDHFNDKQHHGMYLDMCMQPVDIAQEVMDNHFNNILSIAPAEGNNPVKLLTDITNEAKCFPVLFPKGTGTFHKTRKEKITLSIAMRKGYH